VRFGADLELAEIVYDAQVGFVLFVDLHDAGVLGVARGENSRRLTGEKNPGVSAMAINESTDDEHGGQVGS
jgi:hypothetical protein